MHRFLVGLLPQVVPVCWRLRHLFAMTLSGSQSLLVLSLRAQPPARRGL